ncbi:MAG: phage tail tape measure protein, partial [Actinomycetota bacterium]|nr:phage tail tape measure protein [Actinomycetota bacterium]
MPGGKIDILVEPDTKAFPGKLQSGLASAVGVAKNVGKGIGLAIAAGAAVAGLGLGAVIDKGNEYTGRLNEMQAVTSSTGMQMAAVANVAKELGSDLTLPATSAADAAAAMTELAKGGLDVTQAMDAAKGTLQLAAAAQIDAAEAAEIQSAALNSFNLKAGEAGRVADVLANTSNAAAGSIIDVGYSLKYVAPVAAALKISIEDTASAIGLLANQGVKGEQAGTSLRGILASLSSPSTAAKKAMDALGLSVFDAQGKFVGLRVFTDQLSAAKKRLTDQQFAAAASAAFGNEGLTAANALAAEGTVGFDQMATAVGRAGGAADVASAKTRGLGGAWEGLKSQLETVGIGIYESIDGPLERLVRAAAIHTDRVGQDVVKGLETAVSAGELYGPRLADAIRERGAVIGDAVSDVLSPLAEGSIPALNIALNAGLDLWNDFTEFLGTVVDGARPAAEGVQRLLESASAAGAPLQVAGLALGLVGDAAKIAALVLVPIGQIVGVLTDGFAALPGPIQSVVVAMGLLAAFRGRLSDLGSTVTSGVQAPFRALGDEVRLQQALLTGSTNIMSSQVGKVGLAMAALESRVPIIGRMAEAYRDVSTQTEGYIRGQAAIVATSQAIQGASDRTVTAVGNVGGALGRVSGVATGAAAAIGTGLRGAVTGLVGALGGGWGLAITGAVVGLSLLSGAQEDAAKETAAHRANAEKLSDALRESNGAITEQVRLTTAQNFLGTDEYNEAVDAARKLGVGMDDIVNAALRQG